MLGLFRFCTVVHDVKQFTFPKPIELHHWKGAVIAYVNMRACAYAQARQNLLCSLMLAVGLGESLAKEQDMWLC